MIFQEKCQEFPCLAPCQTPEFPSYYYILGTWWHQARSPRLYHRRSVTLRHAAGRKKYLPGRTTSRMAAMTDVGATDQPRLELTRELAPIWRDIEAHDKGPMAHEVAFLYQAYDIRLGKPNTLTSARFRSYRLTMQLLSRLSYTDLFIRSQHTWDKRYLGPQPLIHIS